MDSCVAGRRRERDRAGRVRRASRLLGAVLSGLWNGVLRRACDLRQPVRVQEDGPCACGAFRRVQGLLVRGKLRGAGQSLLLHLRRGLHMVSVGQDLHCARGVRVPGLPLEPRERRDGAGAPTLPRAGVRGVRFRTVSASALRRSAPSRVRRHPRRHSDSPRAEPGIRAC
jgi:hypothetical protein